MITYHNRTHMTAVPTELLQDTHLSVEAKGFAAILYALGDEGVVDVVQEQINLRDGPSAEVLLLTIKRQAARVFPAILEVLDRFQQHASGFRAALNEALANPPADCATLAVVAEKVGSGCKACHQDFR